MQQCAHVYVLSLKINDPLLAKTTYQSTEELILRPRAPQQCLSTLPQRVSSIRLSTGVYMYDKEKQEDGEFS